ncbi:hypothetical protein BD770DRAFT_104707 [Pilaira anomala]|nr:hypothetical protein BD770DRAFT_104707 [Pilaira anomala]
MGNTNSTEGNNPASQQQSRRNSSASIQPTVSTSSKIRQHPFQLSVTEPMDATGESITTDITDHDPSTPIGPLDTTPNDTTTSATATNTTTEPTTTPKAVPVSTGKSGWVSSTGGASPWYGSLGSSASSHHRASISGPYYRTRGMSVTRDNEPEEDLTPTTMNPPTTTQSSQPPIFPTQNHGK